MAKRKVNTKTKTKTLKNSKGGKTKVTHSAVLKSVGQSSAGKKQDKKIKALPAGRRVSDAGNVYFERRANRADKK